MELISKYISKPIISIYEASIIGIVINVTFDRKMKRVCSLLAVSDKDKEEITYSIPINRIKKSDNALVIKNKNSIKQFIENNIYIKCPINNPIYTTNGEYKGIVKDISFNDNFEIMELILNDEKISANLIASASDTLIIIKGKGFTRLQPPRAPRKKKIIAKQSKIEDYLQELNKNIYNNIDTKDEIEEDNYQNTKIDNEEPLEEIQDKISIPARIISDYSFLLDRIVLSDIYSTSGEIIIPSNTKISVATVEIARKHGKLVELTVGSRLNNNI